MVTDFSSNCCFYYSNTIADMQQIWTNELNIRELVRPSNREWEELVNRLDVLDMNKMQDVNIFFNLPHLLHNLFRLYIYCH